MLWAAFGCPQNAVGVVQSNACWYQKTTSTGATGCVACSSSEVDKLCERAFPITCALGACTNR
jgi:hypothetical protein